MSTWNLSFILFFICFTNGVFGFVRYPPQRHGGIRNNFEILKLVQMWSPTSCSNFREISHSSKTACTSCALSKAVNKWTIHGLWPSNGNSQDPSKCSNIKYKAHLLDSLRAELNEKWPSVYQNNDAFWSHEWKKHGTCASNLPATSTIPKYFSTSLKLFHDYNIEQILEEADILPGNNYEFDYLYRAIKEKLGVNVFVQCIRIPETKEQYLSQVRLCFDKSLQLVDCEEDNGYLSNCKRNYKVTYARSC